MVGKNLFGAARQVQHAFDWDKSSYAWHITTNWEVIHKIHMHPIESVNMDEHPGMETQIRC